MNVTIQKGDIEISVTFKEEAIDHVFENILFILLGIGYTIEDIEKEAIKLSQDLKKDHYAKVPNVSPVGL